MVRLNKEQYQALEKVYDDLVSQVGENIDVDVLLLEIDRRVGTGEIPPIFTASRAEAWERYRREVIHTFMAMYEQRRKKSLIGVVRRANSAVSRARAEPEDEVELSGSAFYAPLGTAWINPDVASSAAAFYRHGLSEVRKFGPFVAASGASPNDVATEIEQVASSLRSVETLDDVIGQPQRLPVPASADRLNESLSALYAEYLPHRRKAAFRRFAPFFAFVEQLQGERVTVG